MELVWVQVLQVVLWLEEVAAAGKATTIRGEQQGGVRSELAIASELE